MKYTKKYGRSGYLITASNVAECASYDQCLGFLNYTIFVTKHASLSYLTLAIAEVRRV